MNDKRIKFPASIDTGLIEAGLLNIEAALHLIPHVGGTLATYFGEIRSKRFEQRIILYLNYFSQQLKELNKDKIDKDFLKSEEFAELLAKGADQAAKSTSEKKIKRFADILLNNVILDASSRNRTESIMSFIDRISDLDVIILISYGHPFDTSFLADTKDDVLQYVIKLCTFLDMDPPLKRSVIESVIYLDNLGLTWVNEKLTGRQEVGKGITSKEFSSFRTPLGDEVVKVIVPNDFFIQDVSNKLKFWPDKILNKKYKNSNVI